MIFILMIIIGFSSAFLGSIAGLGGGIIFVPSILLLQHNMLGFEWATPQAIVGMSLLVMIFTGLSSTFAYLKYKRIDVKSGSIFLIGSIPGSLIGVWMNKFVETEGFQLYFGMLMLFISAMFFVRKRISSSKLIKNERGFKRTFAFRGEVHHYTFSVPIALSIAFVVGTCSGLFGIGGGSLMVPAMILLFGFPPHIAAPTSMFMIFVSSSFSSVAHIGLGHIHWEYALYFIPAAWIGGTIGAKVSQKLKSGTIELVLRILIILIGIQLILEGLF
ncbi:hypothetical protein HNQ94_001905 [Salirhabdus euzebyi]|uniref:Probable membrane transporter protein n=1 Tax=Salirhabdus euzebyi TaxID=394506 RepID=A0A841Q4W8_9BACI|nr:sulfite exporter TauE/SafE family protein [Salirhabdus euzebyi]MBB6453456.1 hypothetical protein [Salirhabdus euzebyi]